MEDNSVILTLDLEIVAGAAILSFLISIGIFWIACRLIRKVDSARAQCFGLRDFAKGSDGHYSLSNFQFLIWTFMLTFAFLTVWILRVYSGLYVPTENPDIPRYLLILTGISVASPIASMAITEMKIQKKETFPRPPPKPEGKTPEHKCYFGEMLMQNERPASNRLQNFAWTCISVLIYAAIFSGELTKTGTRLVIPDIDPVLVGLMGVSSLAFLGGKVVEAKQITIRDISPKSDKVGESVTIYGINFGDQFGMVQFEDQRGELEEEEPKEWKTDTIVFTVPEKLDKGDYFVRVRVHDGQLSRNYMKFTVE